MNAKDKSLPPEGVPNMPSPRDDYAHQASMLEQLWPHHTSRRHFLIGAGAGVPLIGPLMRSASQFTTDRDADGATVRIAGLPAWRVDTRWFDGRPRLTHQRSDDSLHIELRNAFLPGTTLRADFVMLARRRHGEWIAQFRFPGLGFTSEVSLPDWLLGMRPALGNMCIADCRLPASDALALHQIQGQAAFTPDWAFHIARSQGGQLSLASYASPVSSLRFELGTAPEQAAPRGLSAWLSLAQQQDLAYPVGRHRFGVGKQGVLAYFNTFGEHAHALLKPLAGATLSWGEPQQIDLPTADAVMRLSLDAAPASRTVYGRLRAAHWHTSPWLAVRLATPELAEPVLLASSGPLQQGLAPPVTSADCFTIPLPGVDAAMFSLRDSGNPATVPICERACRAETVEAFAREDIALDQYELRLRRASDALFCTLRFKGFRLRRRRGAWELYAAAPSGDCLLEVDLGVQHLLEEAVYVSDWSGPHDPDSDMPAPHEAVALALFTFFKTGKPLPAVLAADFEPYRNQPLADLMANLQQHPHYEQLRGSELVLGPPVPAASKVPAGTHFEAARPSHLTFRLNAAAAQQGLPLTIATLFAWSEEPIRQGQQAPWEPVLPARALPAGALSLPGESDPDRPVIYRPLSLASPIPPGMPGFEHATHIEAPARLVISPVPPFARASGRDIAAWQAPPAGPVATDAAPEQGSELWHVRLQNAKVRAVFTPDAAAAGPSSDARAIAVDIFNPPAPYPDATAVPFRTSTDGNDRHQVLALSALYGYRTLIGTYTPLPINADLLLLSSQGASFRYEGAWAPPAKVRGGGALSVRYYKHISQLGRDLFVKVEYKGFLFPVGIPAILIKQTERRFVMHEGKRMVAGLVQRFYIRVPRFRRAYPAVGQPLAGRLWGHASIEIDEFVTPDLVQPEKTAMLGGIPSQWAFWPAVKASLPAPHPPWTEVQFTFGEAATHTRYTAPLVWIDNYVAHKSTLLTEAINAWRSACRDRLLWGVDKWINSAAWQAGGTQLTPPEPRHFATVNSARLPYVIGQDSKNTTIETSRILLGVATPADCGYADEDVPAHVALNMDPLMEAHDQPPFYPVRRRAQIASSQLSALTGNANQRYLIEYDGVYAAAGFAEQDNAGQIFAVFAERGASMSFGEDTARSGAFASPSALMTRLSALRGPLGGSEADVQLLQTKLNCVTPPPGTRALARMSSAAHANELDPKAYFAAALGDAKLLGVVRLADILEVVLTATGTEVPTISRQELFELPLALLRELAPRIDAVLRDNDKWFTDPEANDIPPAAAAALAPAWKRLRLAMDNVNAALAPPAPSESAVLAAAIDVSAAAVALGDATRTLLNDPTKLLPAFALTLLRDAKALIDLLQSLNPPDALLAELKGRLEQLLLQRLQAELTGLLADLAGRKEFAVLCDAIAQVQRLAGELTQAFTAASRLLDALRDNLLTRFRAALRRLSDLALLMAQDACQQLFATLVWPYASSLSNIDIDENLLLLPADILHKAIDRAVALPGATGAAAVDLLATIRQHAVAIAEAIQARISRTRELQASLGKLGNFNCTAPAGEDVALLLATAANGALDVVQLPMTIVMRLAQLQDQLAAPLPAAAIGDLRQAVLAALRAQAALVDVAALDQLAQQLGALAQQWTGVVDEIAVTIRNARAAVVLARAMLFDAANGLLTTGRQFVNAASGELVRTLQTVFQQYFAAAAAIDAARVVIEQSLLALSPHAMQELLQRNVRARLQQLRALLDHTVQARLDELTAHARDWFHATITPRLADGLRVIVTSSAFSYLAPALQQQLQDLAAVLPSKPELEALFRQLEQLFQSLGRALSSGNPGRLVNLQKIIDDIIAAFGIPSRIRISYDWDTEVYAYPKGESCIFEPAGDRRLSISSTIDVSLRGGAPAVTLHASLSPFFLHLFGKSASSNFLSIGFDGLEVSASPGSDLRCKTDVISVQPGAALGFVQRLSAIFGGRSGFFMYPSLHGIRVGYGYHKAFDILGGLFLQNIDLQIEADLPFDNSPVRFTLQLAEKLKPFLISAGIYGGGGFLALHLRADTLESLEASFEYGAMVGFEYGPAVGHGKITAGVYIRLGGRAPVIEGFFCAEGEVSIANIIHMGASLRVVLSYKPDNGQMSGWAEYTFSFSIGLFDYDYAVRVDYAKDGDSQGSGQSSASQRVQRTFIAGQAAGAIGTSRNNQGRDAPDDAKLPSLLDAWNWRRYWLAFAPLDPDHPLACLSVWSAPAACAPVAGAAMPPGASAPLTSVAWFCVPWGATPADACGSGSLRVGLRIMPTLNSQEQAGALGLQALADWPGFVAGIGSVTVATDGARQDIPLGALFRNRLAAWGLKLEDVSALWRGLFPPDLLSRPVATAQQRADTARPETLVLHDSAEVAELSAVRCGQLHANALGDFSGDRFNKRQAYIFNAGLTASGVSLVSGMAALYAPPTRNAARLFTMPGFGHVEAQSEARRCANNFAMRNVLNLDESIETGISSSGSQFFINTPYSDEAITYLLYSLGGAPVRLLANNQLDPAARAVMLRKYSHQTSRPAPSRQKPETFHDRLSGLSTHPWLLKVLGLVVDVQLDGVTDPAWVRVEQWRFGSHDVTPEQCMQTMMEQGYPKTDPATVMLPNAQAGYLNLSAAPDWNYLLTQIDVDRTPERLLQLALAYRSALMAGRRSNEIDSHLQPQETVGLSLIDRKPQGAKPVTPPATPTCVLYLHHLVAGYRADVQALAPREDPSGARSSAWSSLMTRQIRSVKLHGRDLTALFAHLGNDEAILFEKARSLTSSDGGRRAALLKDGELFRWNGWPLGVPRPDNAGAPRETAPPEDSAPADSQIRSAVQIEYESPGGAMRQRFGLGYRVGMRLAMIDGNSLPLAHAANGLYREGDGCVSLGDEVAAADFGYAALLRFEPLPPPVCLLEDKPERDHFPLDASHHFLVASGKGARGRRRNTRILVPPRCANIELAIRHGMFDGPGIQAAPPASAFPGVELSRRGDFPVFRSGSGEQANEAAYYRQYSGAAAPDIPYYPDPWATTLIIGIYRKGDDRLLKRCFFEYYDAQHRWPDCRPLQLELQAAERLREPFGDFEVEQAGQRLLIRALPGCHLVIRVWHEMNLERLNQSAVVDQMVSAALEAGAVTLRSNLKVTAQSSRAECRQALIDTLSQWRQMRDFDAQLARPADAPSRLLNLLSVPMLNPFAEIETLHAVTQPVGPAELSAAEKADASEPALGLAPARPAAIASETPFAVTRTAGESNAGFAGHVRFHRPSTVSIEAMAGWRENASRAVRDTGSGRFTVAVQPRQAQLFQLRDLAAVSRNECGEPARQPMQPEPEAFQFLQRLDCTVPASAARPASRRPLTGAYDFGDTRARVIDVTLRSRSRFAREFAGVDDGSRTLASPAKRVVVQGTERPLPPKVEYVLPLYRWCTTSESMGRKHKSRDAGWFRLWLGPEWYSSGNGELLALVCWPSTLLDPAARPLLLSRTRTTREQFGTPEPRLQPLFTRWGLDPLAREGHATFGNLPSSSLRNRLRNAAQLLAEARPGDATIRQDHHHLQDVPSFMPVHNLDAAPGRKAADDDRQVALALYRPVCDAGTGRWHVDIQIDPRYAYCPFVRLALARYQPHALPHLRLSEIVNSQFVQLLPGRLSTIIPGPEDRAGVKTFTVVLSGTNLGQINHGHGARLCVRLEQQGLNEQYWYAPPATPGAGPDPWQGAAMEFDRSTGQWRKELKVPTRASHNYSIVIEEFECLQHPDDPGRSAHKLVFFDRIMLFP